jgi:hypothetical protein
MKRQEKGNPPRHLRVLSAEHTVIFGVLGDFHLLDDLSQGTTITGSIFTANASLLGVSLIDQRKARGI